MAAKTMRKTKKAILEALINECPIHIINKAKTDDSPLFILMKWVEKQEEFSTLYKREKDSWYKEKDLIDALIEKIERENLTDNVLEGLGKFKEEKLEMVKNKRGNSNKPVNNTKPVDYDATVLGFLKASDADVESITTPVLMEQYFKDDESREWILAAYKHKKLDVAKLEKAMEEYDKAGKPFKVIDYSEDLDPMNILSGGPVPDDGSVMGIEDDEDDDLVSDLEIRIQGVKEEMEKEKVLETKNNKEVLISKIEELLKDNKIVSDNRIVLLNKVFLKKEESFTEHTQEAIVKICKETGTEESFVLKMLADHLSLSLQTLEPSTVDDELFNKLLLVVKQYIDKIDKLDSDDYKQFIGIVQKQFNLSEDQQIEAAKVIMTSEKVVEVILDQAKNDIDLKPATTEAIKNVLTKISGVEEKKVDSKTESIENAKKLLEVNKDNIDPEIIERLNKELDKIQPKKDPKPKTGEDIITNFHNVQKSAFSKYLEKAISNNNERRQRENKSKAI